MRDLMGLMKQAQDLQKRMGELQEELAAAEVTGTSGGGMVTVRLSGKGEMKGISIDRSLLVPDEAEIVEDLVVAAHADARAKADALSAEKMKVATGGLPLPPGFKLPF